MAWNRFSDGGLGNHKRRMTLFGLVFFLLCTVLASYSCAGVDMKVFGPKRYDRTKGQPNVYTDAFDRCEPSDLALLRVTNGSGKDTSVTAGTISINGTVVVGESDFKQQTLLIEKPVAVSQKNVLRVELKSSSRTGSFVVIELVGKNCDSVAPVVYAPTPADGALLNTPRPAIGASYTDEACVHVAVRARAGGAAVAAGSRFTPTTCCSLRGTSW